MAENTIHIRHQGDVLSAIAFQLMQKNESGTLTAVNTTGKTVRAKIVDREGAEVLAETAVGISMTEDLTGKGEFTFPSAAVATAQTVFLYITVDDGSGNKDTFPAKEKDLRIVISGD